MDPAVGALHPQTIILEIKPSGRAGRFLGYVDDDLIVTSRQPFLDSARALLARGHDAATPFNMRHANSDVLSFVTTTIGHAAGLSVVDAAQGTRFRKFAPSDEQIEEDAELLHAQKKGDIGGAPIGPAKQTRH